jgi:predicted nucleic acid-binding Zn ribbon protein
MRHYRPTANLQELTAAAAAPVVACPACSARLAFQRNSTPRIDACGFESYSFECKECGVPFAGIVDPFDDTLLLSEMAA